MTRLRRRPLLLHSCGRCRRRSRWNSRKRLGPISGDLGSGQSCLQALVQNTVVARRRVGTNQERIGLIRPTRTSSAQTSKPAIGEDVRVENADSASLLANLAETQHRLVVL